MFVKRDPFVQVHFMSFGSQGPRRDMGLDDVVIDKCANFCEYQSNITYGLW